MIDLPEIIKVNRFSSEEELLNHAQKIFVHDLIDYPPTIKNKELKTNRDKMNNGYYRSFWHIATEGDHTENDKVIHARIERIPWIRPIIDSQPDKEWLMWTKPWRKKDETRTLIYSEKLRYLIVIDNRKDIPVFWTAFPIDTRHRHERLLKEYEAYR